MPSITDALNSGFNVAGGTIADAVSQITGTKSFVIAEAFKRDGGGSSGNVSAIWSEIKQALENGSYNTKYSIGQVFPAALNLGDEGTHDVRILAFDADDKADGSGKAKMTLEIVDCLNTKRSMNPEVVETQIGTESYTDSALRDYLEDTIAPLVGEVVGDSLVSVYKTSTAIKSGTWYNSSANMVKSTETCFLLSNREVAGAQTFAEQGTLPTYSGVYSYGNNAANVKYLNGIATEYWLRSVSNYGRNYGIVTNSGVTNVSYAENYELGVSFGFCLD